MKYFAYLAALIFVLVGVSVWQKGRQIQVPNSTVPFTVTAEDVKYHSSTSGYYVHPSNSGDYPGVVMIHEWWGLNDHIKNAARDLASQGYRVLAVDLYGGKVATTAVDAMKYRTEYTIEETNANMTDAVIYLRQEGAKKVAGLGWCYGGGKSLELALSGTPLDATIIYYGTLATSTQQLSYITWPVMGVFGDQDKSISTSTVAQFRTALDNIGVYNEIYVYEGVGHAFANPSGDNYAAKEASDAWQKTLAFLRAQI